MRFPFYLYLIDYIGKFFGWYRPILSYRNEVFERYVEQELSDVIEKYRSVDPVFDDCRIPNKIWLLWWQGGESFNDNPLISKCVQRLKALDNFEIHILSKENIADFIDISDVLPFINKTSVQFISDVIRFRLLEKYGGIWLDLSSYLLDNSFFESILEYPFYSAKIPGIHKWNYISEGKYVTFFLASTKANPFMSFMNEALTSFVKKHGTVVDYLQTDYSMMAGYRNIKFIKNLIDNIPENNSHITVINGKLNGKFSSEEWLDVISDTAFLKFSAKRIISIKKYEEDSYYDFLLKYED